MPPEDVKGLLTCGMYVAACAVWSCVALYALTCGIHALWRRHRARAQARRIAAEIADTVATIQARHHEQHPQPGASTDDRSTSTHQR